MNEKPAPARKGKAAVLPEAFSADLVGDDVAALREHPDIRLARRAASIAKLAQIISERKVSRQLRRVLVAQAKRLAWLAEERAKAFASEAEATDED